MKEVQWFENLPSKDMDDAREKEMEKVVDNGYSVNFIKHTEDAYKWIAEIARAAEVEQRQDWAYQALKAVMHTLRDRLTPAEVFHLSAQLPVFIRGVYFEGYQIKDKPDKMHLDEFLQRIEEALGPGNHLTPKIAFRAVLEVLYKHVSKGELRDIYATLPKDLKELWYESMAIESL